MSSLWFVRHGSTVWSERQRLQGWAPIGLSVRGVEEAHDIGRQARRLGIRRIITSPLQRARETARIAARYVPAFVHGDGALCEVNYGVATGCTLEELRLIDERLARRWQDQPWQVRFTTSHGALEDLADAVQSMLASEQAAAIPTLCITHGHVIRAALTVTRQQSAADFWRTDVPAGSIWHLQQPGHLTRTSM